MKTFSLLWLFPCGSFSSGNTEIASVKAENEKQAIAAFWPRVQLNENGYRKDGYCSWCVAQSA